MARMSTWVCEQVHTRIGGWAGVDRNTAALRYVLRTRRGGGAANEKTGVQRGGGSRLVSGRKLEAQRRAPDVPGGGAARLPDRRERVSRFEAGWRECSDRGPVHEAAYPFAQRPRRGGRRP
jgi:hypothetical protein